LRGPNFYPLRKRALFKERTPKKKGVLKYAAKERIGENLTREKRGPPPCGGKKKR